MRGAIGVRIDDGTNDRTVTGRVRGLKFSKQSDGGHKAASFSLTTPLGTFTDLGPSDKTYLSDTTTGLPLFEGYLEAPTPRSGPAGEGYDISALGGMVRAGDESRSLVYVDRNLNEFERENIALASSTSEVGPYENDPTKQRLRLTIPSGSVVNTLSTASGASSEFFRASMKLGGIRVGTFFGGRSDANYALSFVTPTGIVITVDMTAVYTLLTFTGDPNFPSGTDYFALKLRRMGPATNVADDTTWATWVDYSVVGQRMTRDGVLLVGSAGLTSAEYVRADWVIEDLLGRLLRFCDPRTSTVAAGVRQINQLAYTDGTTAQRVLDDLADFEPDYLWEILHSTASGHLFNYRPWPTEPRYEISVRDGYAEAGSDADLCNRVLVTWSDAGGNAQTTVVTATSAQYPNLKALEDAGRTRDAEPISLTEGTGSLANAQAIGAAVLADSAGQPTAARAVVRRPICDLLTNTWAMPWQIEPGHLVRVRETGRNYRLTLMEYDDPSCSTTLTLGYPSRTREQRLAALTGR